MPALSDRFPYQAIVDRPRLRLPNGARLAAWVIVNVEEWRIEKAMPRTVLPPPVGRQPLPDGPNWSWHEYGMRVAFWRQREAMRAAGVSITSGDELDRAAFRAAVADLVAEERARLELDGLPAPAAGVETAHG